MSAIDRARLGLGLRIMQAVTGHKMPGFVDDVLFWLISRPLAKEYPAVDRLLESDA